jgi:hypothetical protein
VWRLSCLAQGLLQWYQSWCSCQPVYCMFFDDSGGRDYTSHTGEEGIEEMKTFSFRVRRREEDMGDINEQPDDNAMHILNDLARGQNDIVRVQNDIARGQQQMVELLTQLVNNTQGNQNNAGNNGSKD